jgi:hypothetical protein
MKSISTVLIVSTLFFFNTYSQNGAGRICSSPKVNTSYERAFQGMMQKHQQFANGKKTTIVYNIPVIFHIVHNGESIGTGRNISYAQIISQITTLNQDYRKTNTDFSSWATQTNFVNAAADCEINFCLANVDTNGITLAEQGIDRIDRNARGWNGPSYLGYPEPGGYIDNTIKVGSSWNPTKYLNIWVIDMNDGVLGYAQFPVIPAGTNPITDMVGNGGADNTDGVVLDYRATGSIGTAAVPYEKGRTATHEIGHWLGLWHINGDLYCGNDYCNDTPTQSSLSSTCPTASGAVVNSGCTSVSPNPPGRMYQNYMDYSDDKCLVMFSADQKARIQAVMANCINRLSLNNSTVCTDVGIKENLANIEMNIYPNPTNGELIIDIATLDIQDFTISVVNTLGQTIKEVKRSQSNGGKIKIDLSDKNTGIYFVIVKSKYGSKVKRIVLQ